MNESYSYIAEALAGLEIAFEGVDTKGSHASFRIIPTQLLQWPAGPTSRDLVNSRGVVALPGLSAYSSDECTVAALQNLRDALAKFIQREASVLEFRGEAGALQFVLRRRDATILIRGELANPWGNWNTQTVDQLMDMISDQCHPFPWTLTFAFFIAEADLPKPLSCVDSLLLRIGMESRKIRTTENEGPSPN